MSVSSIALRRAPLLSSFTALPRARLLAAHLTRPQFTSFSSTARRMDKDQSRGESTTGISEWKTRPPYRVHDKAEDFDVKYTANCHCGKVEYQLSRQEPLDSKLCHCTTCQTQHGAPSPIRRPLNHPANNSNSRPLPMGRHLPQRRHQLHQRPPQPRMVRPLVQINRAQAPLQSALFLLPQPHHGRRAQHDPALPLLNSPQDRR